MKAIQFKKFGIDNLELAEVTTPQPGPYDVLVKIEAVSLNYLDIALVNGIYKPNLALPATPVADGAGVVAAVGSAVTKWKVGDRVTSHYVQQWQQGPNSPETNVWRTGVTTPGLLSEYVVQPEYALVHTPDNLTSVEASTLPIAGLISWTALIDQAAIKPGHVVLTQGTGGASLFALQIALAAGARVIATTGSPQKVEKLKQLGAHEVINYKEYPEWQEEVRRLTNGEGVHATIDVAGSATINNSVKSVRYYGYVASIGFLSGTQLPLDLLSLVYSYVRVQGLSGGSLQSFREFTAAIQTNNIKPVVDTIFPFDAAQEAFKYVLSGNHFGKVVIEVK
ncbi:MAG TPA: NAD(P)-dependent alcohol dehydrogenase [Chitinophaga sp.]|uniref:zinc-dependent alcohol dehydrogenase family protein n=1 Tax=Chitinophaga sp. TaxID=1869181 RepID=UPI002CCF9542|nr:NAD(P)-dependent alcohol dehydrogenase [Chitinophaga sp.]HVI46856.1 NAD(P)-dependent alcohol dehydrogenase [Chitinophaga sp.]